MKKNTLIFLILLATLQGCNSPVFIAEPFDATVVDAETGEAIEGAIVIANWARYVGTVHGYDLKEQLETMEAVTDAAGKFSMAGFRKVNLPLMYSTARGEDPQIIIFKPGYEFSRWSNGCPSAEGDCRYFSRRAVVAGKTIKLKRLNDAGKLKDPTYFRYFGLNTRMENIVENCNWKRIPKFILAADAEYEQTMRAGFINGADLPELSVIERQNAICGSARAHLAKFRS